MIKPMTDMIPQEYDDTLNKLKGKDAQSDGSRGTKTPDKRPDTHQPIQNVSDGRGREPGILGKCPDSAIPAEEGADRVDREMSARLSIDYFRQGHVGEVN